MLVGIKEEMRLEWKEEKKELEAREVADVGAK